MYTYWLTYGFSDLWAIFSKLKVNVTAVKTQKCWRMVWFNNNLVECQSQESENLWLDTKGHSLLIPTKADSILAGLKKI